MRTSIQGLALAAATSLLAPRLPAQVLQYSTYLGGTDTDWAQVLAVEPLGRAWIAGSTRSFNFPTLSPYQPSLRYTYDVFVSRISSSGSSLLSSTFLGGADIDFCYGIALDDSGRPCLTGATSSDDFPTFGAYQPGRQGGDEIFVCRLSPSGAALEFSTYLGGSGDDYAYGIGVGPGGRIQIGGFTKSLDFPSVHPYQPGPAGGDNDGLIACLSSSGAALDFSTYLGGAGEDYLYGLALDSRGRTFVAGNTTSPDFPLSAPFQPSYGGGYTDSCAACLSSSGAALDFSTYLGGSGDDYATAVAVGADGRAWLGGYTSSPDFPVRSPYQPSAAGGFDATVGLLSSSGSALLFSTYLGGESDDLGKALALDSAGRAGLAGYTFSSDFPTRSAWQAQGAGGADAFVSSFAPGGSSLDYSTYLGGSGNDYGYDLAAGAGRSAYLAGDTRSSDFPTAAAFQPSFAGSSDGFLAKLLLAADPRRDRVVVGSGDYAGDGTSAIAIFRPETGLWSVRGLTAFFFGASSDSPTADDFDGDGRADPAIFRPSSGLWSIRSLTRFTYGTAGDIPVPGDYDGDGRAEAAVFREASGQWFAHGLTRFSYGALGDRPAPGDYAGDGTARAAVYRAAAGSWLVRDLTRIYLGGSTDLPAAGDYRGDGTWAPAIFRPDSGLWSILDSTRIYFGGYLDWPRPADYDGDGRDDVAVFRPAAGYWSAHAVTWAYFGREGDRPVTR